MAWDHVALRGCGSLVDRSGVQAFSVGEARVEHRASRQTAGTRRRVQKTFTKGLRGSSNLSNIPSLATTATQRKRRSGGGDGLESPVVGGFGACESLRRRAKKAKKTVDDDEKLRHNLASLLQM
ncbi:hypothetical protein, partial [Pandoraea soli]|uniref:hypothetical protein n=1 Tax=Pandoraea soli TaxID=2508293 RepID=UPI001C2DB4C9